MSADADVIGALDLGTSRVKGALFDARSGAVLARHAVGLPALVTSGARVEQDVDVIVAALREVVVALAAAVQPGGWRALSIVTQRGTLVAADERGRPTLPLMSWLDRRGGEVGGDRYDWLLQHATTGVAHVWSLASYCAWHLTGEALETDQTAPPERARIGGRLRASKIVEPGFKRTVADTELARALDLPRHLRVVIAGGDKNAEVLGAGGARDGYGVVSFGTATSLGVLAAAGLEAAEPGAFTTSASVPGRRQWEVGLPGGGEALRWVDGLLGVAADLRGEPAMDAPLFLPYLRGSLTSGDERGAWVGMVAGTTAGDLRLAAREGLVLDLLAQGDALPVWPQHLVVVGGGSKDEVLPQLVADAFQVPVDVLAESDAGVHGAVMIAGVAEGMASGMDRAFAIWGGAVAATLDPRPEREEAWEARLARFFELRDRLS